MAEATDSTNMRSDYFQIFQNFAVKVAIKNIGIIYGLDLYYPFLSVIKAKPYST